MYFQVSLNFCLSFSLVCAFVTISFLYFYLSLFYFYFSFSIVFQLKIILLQLVVKAVDIHFNRFELTIAKLGQFFLISQSK